MHTTLPTQARVDITPFELSEGLVGLVEGVHAIMSYVLADELPDALALDELLAVSAVAFKNYVYEPEYNQLEDPKAFSALGELICNYGPFESLSYYSGWDVKEFNGIGRNDFWKLLQFEIASGRPVVTLGAGGPLGPVLVVGYRFEPRAQTLEVIRAGSSEIATVDVTGLQDFQGDDPSFNNWMLIARPGEAPEWASSHTRQRQRVLRWVAKHARQHKEFSQETRDNYAPGLRGFESFLGLLDSFGEKDTEWPEGDPFRRWVLAHVDGLARARRAAARRLPVWSADFLSGSDLDLDARQAVEEALDQGADAYEEVAAYLEGWQDGRQEGGALTSDDLQELWRAYTKACAAEESAVEGLEAALKHLPKGF
jgi:hypothetical protein